MKRISVLVMVVFSALFWSSCRPSPSEKPKEAGAGKKPATLTEKVSYVAGQDIGRSLKARGTEIDLALAIQGIEDSFMGREPLLTAEEASEVKKEYAQKIREEHERMRKDLGEKNKAEGEAFLAENANNEGVVTTENGLQYAVITKGDGPTPKATDQVRVNYVGTLIDGTEFDSSYKRGQPATLALNRVIPGWTEGLQLMPVGSKYRFVIPPKLAYGERGAGAHIGPNAVLIFEIELLDIVKQPEAKPDTGAKK